MVTQTCSLALGKGAAYYQVLRNLLNLPNQPHSLDLNWHKSRKEQVVYDLFD